LGLFERSGTRHFHETGGLSRRFRTRGCADRYGSLAAGPGALVNKSLLRRDPESTRYEAHEILRQYAAEKLGGCPDIESDIKNRHCLYYLELLRRCESAIQAGRQQNILPEKENTRVSWQYAIEHKKIAAIGQAMEALRLLYDAQGWYQEGLVRLRKYCQTR
jgi:predicted ATPase